MKRTPLTKTFGSIAIWVTALASIHLFLAGLGYYNILTLPLFINTPAIIRLLYWIVGLSGVVSLVLTFMAYSESGCTFGWRDKK